MDQLAVIPLEAPAAAGVDYVAMTGAPAALRFFKCLPHRATLSTKACGARWRDAQVAATHRPAEPDAPALSVTGCRGCPIGAAHAGATHVAYSRHYGAAICPRCRKGATRFILGGRLCVSCYNRAREMASGRNARGNAPSELLAARPLHTVTLRIIEGNRAVRVSTPGVADTFEPIFRRLRDAKGDVAFAFAPPLPLRAQPDLFGAERIASPAPPRPRAHRKRIPRGTRPPGFL